MNSARDTVLAWRTEAHGWSTSDEGSVEDAREAWEQLRSGVTSRS